MLLGCPSDPPFPYPCAMHLVRKSRGKPRIGREESVHLVLVPGKDDDHLVLVCIAEVDQHVDGLAAELCLALRQPRQGRSCPAALYHEINPTSPSASGIPNFPIVPPLIVIPPTPHVAREAHLVKEHLPLAHSGIHHPPIL